MSRSHWFLIVAVIAGPAAPMAVAEEPRVLLEIGRDYPETRLFSVCPVSVSAAGAPWLAVAGFSQTGHGDVADLMVFDLPAEGNLRMRSRVMRGAEGASSIRTLRAGDLDGDGVEELAALGRIGNEEVDSRGELQILRFQNEQWQSIAVERWQSGQYTHGYGMEIGDVDADGHAEIVTGGFFARDDRDRAELRVWRVVEGRLALVASTDWGTEAGHTRINSVRLGDVTGDGQVDIVTAGRTGQVQPEEHVTTAEADQLIVWKLTGAALETQAELESEPESRSRFRELRLADLDGGPGLELLAVGRQEPPRRSGRGGGGGRGAGTGGGRGDGSGGGRGDGTGGGRGDGSGGGRRGEQGGAVRPLLSVFQFGQDGLARVFDADFGEAFGEIRDVEVIARDGEPLQVVTITADDLKPQRAARLDVWKAVGLTLTPQSQKIVSLGDETRARQLRMWGPPDQLRILTIGFVTRGDQILGQILDWGTIPATQTPR